MAIVVSTKEAAALLGTTTPTVRALIEAGKLAASKERRGSKFRWLVESVAVDTFLAANGRYDERSRVVRPNLMNLNERLSALEQDYHAHSVPSSAPSARNEPSQVRRLEDALARIVDLEEALARSHTSIELQSKADDERAQVVQYLLDAIAASERADELRRRAQVELEEAIQAFSRPGHAGDLRGS